MREKIETISKELENAEEIEFANKINKVLAEEGDDFFSDNVKVLDFNTLTDARTWFSNSGFFEWEWFEGFDKDELIKYAYNQSDGEKTQNEIVRDFLLLKKQNPRDYDL